MRRRSAVRTLPSCGYVLPTQRLHASSLRIELRALHGAVGVPSAQDQHLSLFRSGKVHGVRFFTLSKLCAALGCEPGDLIKYDHDPADLTASDEE